MLRQIAEDFVGHSFRKIGIGTVERSKGQNCNAARVRRGRPHGLRQSQCDGEGSDPGGDKQGQAKRRVRNRRVARRLDVCLGIDVLFGLGAVARRRLCQIAKQIIVKRPRLRRQRNAEIVLQKLIELSKTRLNPRGMSGLRIGPHRKAQPFFIVGIDPLHSLDQRKS